MINMLSMEKMPDPLHLGIQQKILTVLYRVVNIYIQSIMGIVTFFIILQQQKILMIQIILQLEHTCLNR